MLPRTAATATAALAQLPTELASAISNAILLNPQYNAFSSLVAPEDALAAYQAAQPGSELYGIGVAVKDAFCTRDLPTTAGSRILSNYRSPFEATVVTRLREAGAILTGKTNMDEFGMGSANLHSHFGPAVNPANPDGPPRVPGGSSGGSAVAVALGLSRIALGTDTGGSTRLPAAYCGVVGLKPSYGLLSRWGVIAYASSLDCVGIMAKEVADVRTTLDILSHHDEKDPTSASKEARAKSAALEEEHWKAPASLGSLKGLRVGVPAEFFLSELSPLVLPPFRKTLELLKSLGATLTSVSLPSTPHALSAYYVLASAEASSNLARYDGVRFGTRNPDDLPKPGEEERLRPLYGDTRQQGFGREVQKRLLLGAYALSADAFDNYYLNAQRVRAALRAEFDAVFRSTSPLALSPSSPTPSATSSPPPISRGVDLLLHPSATSTAPLLSAVARTSKSDDAAAAAAESYTQDILNVPASLAGLPALSLPVGRASDGWPVGVQIVGQWGRDGMVLRVAQALQEAHRN